MNLFFVTFVMGGVLLFDLFFGLFGLEIVHIGSEDEGVYADSNILAEISSGEEG